MKSVKNKYSKIEGKVAAHNNEDGPVIELERSCRDAVKNSVSLYSTINILMRKLFSEDEILNHSVSGKAANSKTAAKPKFEANKLDLLKKIAIDIHGKVVSTNITEKIQAVKRENKSKNNN